MGCGFHVVKGDTASEPGHRTPQPPVSDPVPYAQTLAALLEGQSQLKTEFAEVKASLAAYNELHAKRYDDLIALLSDFLAKVFAPSP